MACDEVDPSLITTQCCKQKISSYITNKDNNSADKAKTIKRLKKTLNQSESQASVVDDAGIDSTSAHHHSEDFESNKRPKEKAHSGKASKYRIVDSDPPDTDVKETTEEPEDIEDAEDTAAEDAEDTEEAEIEAPEEDAEQELGKFICQYFKHATDATYLAE